MICGGKRRALKTRSSAARFALVAALACASIALPLGAVAQVSLDIVIHTPPPPVRVEVVPAPRPGFVWAPGYWTWDGHHHIWSAGHWEAERPDHHFVPAQWVDTPGGWRFIPAHWEHAEPAHSGFCPPGQAKKGRC